MDYKEILKRNDLKILEDIGGYHIDYFSDKCIENNEYQWDIEHGTNFRTLRKEIIKWIKSGDMSSSEALHIWKPFVAGNDIITSMIAIKKFLMFWLNITDEELK